MNPTCLSAVRCHIQERKGNAKIWRKFYLTSSFFYQLARHVIKQNNGSSHHINIYLIYTNVTERKSFLGKVNAKLNSCGSEEFFLLGGELNCRASSSLSTQSKGIWSILMTWWLCGGGTESRHYTWYCLSEDRISSARPDRFYCFKHHQCFRGCKIIPVGFIDDSLVLGEIAVKNILPKSMYWHFNSSLALAKGFRDVLHNFWFVFWKSEFTCLRQ